MAKQKQLTFDKDALAAKRFTLDRLIESKFNRLSEHMENLSHSDVVWLSRVEDFFVKCGYVTERQVSILDSIYNRLNQAS